MGGWGTLAHQPGGLGFRLVGEVFVKSCINDKPSSVCPHVLLQIISLCTTEVAVCLHASLTHQAGAKPAWQVGEVCLGGEGHAGELFALCISDSASSILDNLS